jgi:hypothetical protein
MFHATGVTLQVGPISLLALARLDWERVLLGSERRRLADRRAVRVTVGPLTVLVGRSRAVLLRVE